MNDLANEINNMHCGVDIDGLNESIMLYADNIVLLSDSEINLQSMLDKLNHWCNKWRLTVNECKTKILHFRSQNKNRSNFVFKCGDDTIAYETSY